MTAVNNEKKETVGLKRELGLFSAVSLIVAVMIGEIFYKHYYTCDPHVDCLEINIP